MFHNDHFEDDLGPLSTPAICDVRVGRHISTRTGLLTILVQALSSLLWLVIRNDACERSIV